MSGDGVWGARSSALAPHNFSGCAYLPAGAKAGQAFELAVRARVDAAWGAPPAAGHSPRGVAPQSHLARARTLASYDARSNGRRVRGRVTWLSSPLSVRVVVGGEAEGGGGGGGVAAAARAAVALVRDLG